MSDESAKPESVPFSKAEISLTAKDLALANEVSAKVGSRVRLVLTGTVQEVTQGNSDTSEEGATAGRLVLMVNQLRIGSNNDIAELFSDEIDG